MAFLGDMLKEILSLTANVRHMQEDVGSLLDKVDKNRERIIKLESNQESGAPDTDPNGSKDVERIVTEINDQLSRLEDRLNDPGLGC